MDTCAVTEQAALQQVCVCVSRGASVHSCSTTTVLHHYS